MVYKYNNIRHIRMKQKEIGILEMNNRINELEKLLIGVSIDKNAKIKAKEVALVIDGILDVTGRNNKLNIITILSIFTNLLLVVTIILHIF